MFIHIVVVCLLALSGTGRNKAASSFLLPQHGGCHHHPRSRLFPFTSVATQQKPTVLFTKSFPSKPDRSDTVCTEEDTAVPVDAIVCGGGPAGLLAAIMLSRRSTSSSTIHVYDRLKPPPAIDDESVWLANVGKFYLIGLGERGQAALKKMEVWTKVRDRSVVVRGRCDWVPGATQGAEVIYGSERPILPHVLPRDKLVGILYQHVRDHCPNVQLHYGYELHPVDLMANGGTHALVQASPTASEDGDMARTAGPSELLVTRLLLAADGATRTIANAMEQYDQDAYAKKHFLRRLFAKPRFRIQRYEDNNQRVYKTIPLKIPWRSDLNYSARTARLVLDALPASTRGDYCAVLLLRPKDPLARAYTDPHALRAALDKEIPQFSALLSDTVVEQVARKPVSTLPGFRYATPRLHQGAATLLIGDCAHSVKPFFGLGANSALEDVEELEAWLDRYPEKKGGGVETAVQKFSRNRSQQIKTMVRVSRSLDFPGILGLVNFLLPIIMDGVFGKLAPRVFAPNIITMLQRDRITFRQAARRKRLDRLVQVTFLSGGLFGSATLLYHFATWLVGSIIRIRV